VCAVLIGLYSIVTAARDWDWFMNHRQAALVVLVFKRSGARLIYIAVGVALIVIGVHYIVPDDCATPDDPAVEPR